MSLSRKLESLCRKALYDYNMIEGEAAVAVALSGGKDSLTLLAMLKRILGRGFPAASLVAIHVDGEFTCGAGVNKPFLQKFCDNLNVPLVIKNSTQTLETLECYSCSRERRALLFNAAKEHGARTIAFGHHRDDNAQTLVMNLLQKGEFAGMLPKIPMVKYGVTILRPLIYADEEMIRSFARQQGFARITCQCPVGQDSKRKKVDQLLSEMTDHFPNARQNLARASLDHGSDKASKI